MNMTNDDDDHHTCQTVDDSCVLACELSNEKPYAKWEIEGDDGDGDFLCHTLFLKQVTAID